MRNLGFIPLGTLKTGDNRFELEGQARDFGCEVREVKENPSFQGLVDGIKVGVVITRSGRRFLVRGRLKFRARLKCAICGEDYEQAFDEEMIAEFTMLKRERLVYAKELEPEELDRLPVDADFVNLTQMVRDAIHLAIPIAPKCRPDCKGICPVCGVNRNEVECNCAQQGR